jgi:flagellar basal-body rod protein FlgG
MLQGLYAAASGMEAQQTQFDAISNDLANLNTPGYQGTQVGFESLLYSGGGSASGSSVATGSGAASSIVGRSQVQGAINQTGNPLDVAISGPGYLEVRRSDGTVGLTRNGRLELSAQGDITDQLGNPLVPPVRLPQGVAASDLKIQPDGTLMAGSRPVGRIGLVNVPAPNQLQANGDSTFSVTAGSGPARTITSSSLQQGALESSNVDMAEAMTDMINSEKTYQMSSQAIQYQDQMLQIADQLRK